jgi:LPXTG-motif cell wall-anchored protein
LVSGDGWQVALEAADTSGTPLSLDDSGNIILNSDRNVSFSGTGYAPGSTVKVWMFSDPTSVTQVTADESGKFTGLAQIPAGLPDGEHTLQLNGVNKNGQIRSVAMGVLIAPVATPAVPATPSAITGFDPLWLALFVLVLIASGAVLWFRRRKVLKTRSEDAAEDNVVIDLYPKAS